MKYSPEIIKKAKQLRSEGKSNSEIANALSISRRTIIRWVKGVPKGGGDMSPVNVTEHIENAENLKRTHTITNTEGLKELKNIGDTEKLNNNSFHGMKVSYNPDGGITIAEGDKTDVPEPTKPYVPEPLKDQKPEPLLEQKLDAIKTKPKDIDLLGILLPAACLGAGLLLDGKKGMKGEFHEQNDGGDW